MRHEVFCFAHWIPPCQFPVSPTSSTLLFTIVKSFTGLVQNGGYCVLLPWLPHPPFVPINCLLCVVMMDLPIDLASTSVTGGGGLLHNCALHDARRPCSCEERFICAYRLPQCYLHTPFRW